MMATYFNGPISPITVPAGIWTHGRTSVLLSLRSPKCGEETKRAAIISNNEAQYNFVAKPPLVCYKIERLRILRQKDFLGFRIPSEMWHSSLILLLSQATVLSQQSLCRLRETQDE